MAACDPVGRKVSRSADAGGEASWTGHHFLALGSTIPSIMKVSRALGPVVSLGIAR